MAPFPQGFGGAGPADHDTQHRAVTPAQRHMPAGHTATTTAALQLRKTVLWNHSGWKFHLSSRTRKLRLLPRRKQSKMAIHLPASPTGSTSICCHLAGELPRSDMKSCCVPGEVPLPNGRCISRIPKKPTPCPPGEGAGSQQLVPVPRRKLANQRHMPGHAVPSRPTDNPGDVLREGSAAAAERHLLATAVELSFGPGARSRRHLPLRRRHLAVRQWLPRVGTVPA